jgi:hypothetical protein
MAAEDRAATRDAVSRAGAQKGLGTPADLFSKNRSSASSPPCRHFTAHGSIVIRT